MRGEVVSAKFGGDAVSVAVCVEVEYVCVVTPLTPTNATTHSPNKFLTNKATIKAEGGGADKSCQG